MSPRAATAARARSSSRTRRSIHGRSSRIAAAASRSGARRGSTTSTPRAASTVDPHAPRALGAADAVGDLAPRRDRVRSRSRHAVVPGPARAAAATGAVALRLGAERDIPEILIAHQDDPQLHARLGLERPPSGAELGRRAERAADRARGRDAACADDPRAGGSDVCRGQIDVHRRRLGPPAGRARDLGRAAGRAAAGWPPRRCGSSVAGCSTPAAGAPRSCSTEPDNAADARARPRGGVRRRGRPARLRARARPAASTCAILSLLASRPARRRR